MLSRMTSLWIREEAPCRRRADLASSSKLHRVVLIGQVQGVAVRWHLALSRRRRGTSDSKIRIQRLFFNRYGVSPISPSQQGRATVVVTTSSELAWHSLDIVSADQSTDDGRLA